MNVIIKDNLLRSNYYLRVTLNDKPIEYIYEKNKFIIGIPNSQAQGELKCYFQNAMFSESKSGLKMFLYWLLCIFGGTGEYGAFGIPYDLMLIISLDNNSDADIEIAANKFSSSLPFSISKGNCIIKENKYIAVRGYYQKWIFGEIMPISIIFLLACAMIFLLAYATGIIVLQAIIGVFIVIGGFILFGYVKNILSKNNTYMKR